MPPGVVNTAGDIGDRTNGFAVANLLQVGQYDMVMERFGQIDPQGQNKTRTRKYKRYHSLPRATAPLAEGIAPAGQQINSTDITVTLEQFGDLVWITDVIADTHEDPVLKEMTKRCGEAAAETKEVNRISVLKGGSNVSYAAGVASRALVNSPALVNDLRRSHRAFKKNKAREFTEIIGATAMVSTEPISRGYFALGNTDSLSDLKQLDGWVPVAQYGSSMKALPNEYGAIEEFRFILTPLFEPWEAAGLAGTTYLSGGVKVSGNTACDVYPIILLARDSYAIVPLQGKKAVEFGVKNPGERTVANPLGQLGFVSWSFWDGTVILNQLWVDRLEVAATAL